MATLNEHGSKWVEVITPGRFADETVIVTGAGSGIGRATALRVAREGGRVIACDIDSARLDQLLVDGAGLNIVAVPGDVSDEEDVQAIVRTAGSTIHGLANIAGIVGDFAAIHDVTDETLSRVFDVNVIGTIRLSRAVVPLMMSAGTGSIVNIASEAAFRGSVAGVAYTASKHAVVGITRSAAVIYGPQGLRVNAVAPGSVKTNIEADFSAASDVVKERLEPLRQAIRPPAAESEQLAASITYLLSRDSTNVNGAILPSDGGWSAI